VFIKKTTNVRYTSQGSDNMCCLKSLTLCFIVAILCPVVCAGGQISQFGITWTFDKQLSTDGSGDTYQYGEFANGDYWVVGPVTITGISPPSTEISGRTKNGSEINPSPSEWWNGLGQGYDSHYYITHPGAPFYNPGLNVALDISESHPLIVNSNSSLVSTISLPEPGARPQLKSAAILTVLASPPPEGSFRPPYCGSNKTIKFNKQDLDYSLLDTIDAGSAGVAVPRLKPLPGDDPQIQGSSVERMFERPWLDHIPTSTVQFQHPTENMEDYGRELATQVGIGALMLHLDYSGAPDFSEYGSNNAYKETLLIRYVQVGIDLYGVVQDGGHHNWEGAGGHGQGRKWPILFAGLMLNDADMKAIGARSGDYLKTGQYGPGNPPPDYIYFSEDMQTYYVTADDVGRQLAAGYSPTQGNWLESDIGLPTWAFRHATFPEQDGKAWHYNGYRWCCTGNARAGLILAALIMDAKALWNHDVVFDYQDRYMATWRYILDHNLIYDGYNYSDCGRYNRQVSEFAEQMWDTYRSAFGPVWPDTATDNTPPTILRVTVQSPVHILFSESLDGATATDISNYSISPSITIYSATLEQDHRTVVLTTSDHAENVEYVLTVNGVQDLAGNSIVGATYAYRLSSGLIGHWKLDDGDGSIALDSSDQSNNGTLINNPTWTTDGRINGALIFDGINDYIEIGAEDIAPPWTAVLWVKREQSLNSNVALLESPSYSLKSEQYPNTNKVGFTAYGLADYSFNYEAPVGSWVHLAFVATQTQVTLYVDGVLTDTIDASISCPMGQISSDSRPAKGQIDDVRVYNRALTEAKVLELFNEAPSLVFEPIDDKEVDEGSELRFDVNVLDPNIVVDINDHSLPSDPCFFYNGGDWTFSWTPTYDDAGSYEVTFEAPNDEYVDFETITITVNNVNRQPLFTPAIGDKSVFEGNELRFTISAIDPDGDPITYSATNLPARAVFSSDTFAWTPGYKQSGWYQVTFVASDGQDQDSETITIEVKNQNGPPDLKQIDDKSVSENSLLRFSISATDPDDDLITYSCPNLPSGAVLTGDTFEWTPTSGQTGVYEVTFVASDGPHQDSQTITISVVNFNIADPTLVGSWLLDDDPANGALDTSQYGNAGYSTVTSRPTVVSGKVGNAYLFDGVDDGVEVPYSPSLNADKVTLSAWIYVNSYKNDQRIISKETGVRRRDSIYALLLSGKRDRKLQFRLALKGVNKGKRLTSNSTIPLNEWTHVAAVFNGKYVRLYINGTLDKKARRSRVSRPLRHNNEPVYIGGSQFYNCGFDGKIDDVRIYNKALGAASIPELYGQ
jgi:hypothetical protein